MLFTENIYNWTNIDTIDLEPKPPLYKSKYSSSVINFYEKQKSFFPKTMGDAQTPRRHPNDYLKKHSGEKKLEAETKSVPCLCREMKHLSLEKFKARDLTPSTPKRSERNFLKENSLLAQKTPPTSPKQKIVDDRNGHSFQLDVSGWFPKYTYKEDYGKKPKYIEAIEKNLAEAREAFKKFLENENQLTKPVKLTEKEKNEIFEGVVRNWKELLRRYLMMPTPTETPLQLRRKIEIEKRIDSLERDIEYLMRNRDIFVGKKNEMRNIYMMD